MVENGLEKLKAKLQAYAHIDLQPQAFLISSIKI